VAEIEDEFAFPPSPLCGFCSFNGNGCLAGANEGEDEGEIW
jgi:hypothetical protein